MNWIWNSSSEGISFPTPTTILSRWAWVELLTTFEVNQQTSKCGSVSDVIFEPKQAGAQATIIISPGTAAEDYYDLEQNFNLGNLIVGQT